MRTDPSSSNKMTLFTLLGSAAIGAIVMALVTPKTGREVRNTLRTASRRLRGKVAEPDEFDTGTIDALFI